jgi:hypothetical protein
MINVIWYNGCRGNWDSGLLCSIFDAHPDVFIQHNSKQNLYCNRAIVIVAGMPDVIPLRNYLESIPVGIVILTSEEDSFFDWKSAIPPHLEIWTQYYSQNKSEIKERLLLGPPNRLKDYKINKHLPKKYLWSFVGQVQNPFRQACVDVLKTLPDGFLHVAEMFGGVGGSGMEYQEYLDIMCQSVYVICPAGSMCVDSFRLYEAMECDAIPITDVRAPRDPEDFNYWKDVYPDNRVYKIEKWLNLSYMFNGTHEIFKNELIQASLLNESKNWWSDYKQQLENKLLNAANQN